MNPMPIHDNLATLEQQLATLIASVAKLSMENQSLRQKLLKVIQERADLTEKNQRAVTRIKRIITQLRNENL